LHYVKESIEKMAGESQSTVKWLEKVNPQWNPWTHIRWRSMW